MNLDLQHHFAQALPELHIPWRGLNFPEPALVIYNDHLADELGLPERPDPMITARLLSGMETPPAAQPVAQAYAGHQFGQFVPRLGDGRALLLGELATPTGELKDLHLKGSGPTPFARGGDGRAVLGPMLREYLMGEAMHALGIPTTRALAVVLTGERVFRPGAYQPGAVLARIAASHIRVGTFQYAAVHHGPELVGRLAEFTIGRHDPDLLEQPEKDRYRQFFQRVVERQLRLISQWMAVGFVHGVMNSDNTTLSGETIDYGPCAFMEAHHPQTVFSSIDHQGRYAYGNQPRIIQWNLARLAETLLPLFDADSEAAHQWAEEQVATIPQRFQARWQETLRAKLGLRTLQARDEQLTQEFLEVCTQEAMDHTLAFRRLADAVAGDDTVLLGLARDPRSPALTAWLRRWRQRLDKEPTMPPKERAAVLRRINPAYIPRNHLVEAALEAAAAGDLQPFQRLLAVVRAPFEEREADAEYLQPAPEDFGPYRTTCGT